uniref:Uncharacterized protein n=1 Tax=Clastoptera arizonana TaxID=38151 RepID=A0A1B6EDT2_9HEMI
MIKALGKRRCCLTDPLKFKLSESSRRSKNFEISDNCDIETVHSSRINTLDIDNIEGRYLLSGCSDGSFYVHDLYNFTGKAKFTSKMIVSKNNRNEGHSYSVESIQWYPFDLGMFTSGSTDKTIKIWDSNVMKLTEIIAVNGKVFQHHMSTIPSMNPITAVATGSKEVYLVDIRIGMVQELRGHTNSIACCQWSPRSEYLLASGSFDRKIILWDVRSTKSCQMILDQFNKDPLDKTTNMSHNSSVNGLQFTEDGMHLISLGKDNSMKLWNILDGKNQMLNYGFIKNSIAKHVQLDVSRSTNPDLVFVPSEGNILVYEILSGRLVKKLSGHYDLVTACYYHSRNIELYSAGQDRNLIVWVHSDDEGDPKHRPFLDTDF